MTVEAFDVMQSKKLALLSSGPGTRSKNEKTRTNSARLQDSARLCKIMQEHARFCKNLQDFARLLNKSKLIIDVFVIKVEMGDNNNNYWIERRRVIATLLVV